MKSTTLWLSYLWYGLVVGFARHRDLNLGAVPVCQICGCLDVYDVEPSLPQSLTAYNSGGQLLKVSCFCYGNDALGNRMVYAYST